MGIDISGVDAGFSPPASRARVHTESEARGPRPEAWVGGGGGAVAHAATIKAAAGNRRRMLFIPTPLAPRLGLIDSEIDRHGLDVGRVFELHGLLLLLDDAAFAVLKG